MNLYDKETASRIMVHINDIAMTTERYVKNRKYVAVVNECCNRTKILDCTNLVGYTYQQEWNELVLLFSINDEPYWVYDKDCVFYKKAKPPILKEIKNKIEQNQI